MRNFQKRQLLDIVDELHMLHQQSRDHLLKEEQETGKPIMIQNVEVLQKS